MPETLTQGVSVARAMAHKATAAATLRAYKADWTHFSQ
jgi:hypothetical protein